MSRLEGGETKSDWERRDEGWREPDCRGAIPPPSHTLCPPDNSLRVCSLGRLREREG
jgi:hypothetical protein